MIISSITDILKEVYEVSLIVLENYSKGQNLLKSCFILVLKLL